MHEFSIARSVHEIALEEANRHHAGHVLSVTCRVGVLRQIVPALLDSAFDAVNLGTPLAGSVLKIEREPVRICCAACGRSSPSEELSAACPACGSPRIRFFGGMDFQVVSIAIEDKESSHEHSSAAQCA